MMVLDQSKDFSIMKKTLIYDHGVRILQNGGTMHFKVHQTLAFDGLTKSRPNEG